MNEPDDLFLRDSDAFSRHMERDPILRSTIVAVAWLDASPDWARLVDKLERASRLVPSFRMRLIEPGLPVAAPRWVVAEDFDLTWHLSRVDAPEPHTDATVIDLARTEAMTAFDPAHPLWKFTLIEHLEGDRAALLMKVHHSLTDGVGGMKLALNLFDTMREPPPLGPEPVAPATEPLSRNALVRQGMSHNWARVVDLARHEVISAAPAAVLGAARHPIRSAAGAATLASSIGRMVAPVSKTMSTVMTNRGLGRRLDMLTVSLADLKGAAATADGSVNDGFLAGLTGGLRRYHERHGAAVDELRVTLPISIRADTDPVAGNRITLQRFTVPVGVADTAARIRAIEDRCRSARDEPALAYTNAIAGVLNLLPSTIVGGMLKHVDFLASNVPGFPFPVYLAGAEMTGYFPFGPTIGAAVNATLLSYNGVCCVGVTIDTAAIPDSDAFMACLAEGFDEVLALGGKHRKVSRPLHGGAAPRKARAAHAERQPVRPA